MHAVMCNLNFPNVDAKHIYTWYQHAFCSQQGVNGVCTVLATFLLIGLRSTYLINHCGQNWDGINTWHKWKKAMIRHCYPDQDSQGSFLSHLYVHLYVFVFAFQLLIPLQLLPSSVSALWTAKCRGGENVSVWRWRGRGSALSWTLSVLHSCFHHSRPPACVLFIPLHLSSRSLLPTSHFPIFPFYLTALFPLLLSFLRPPSLLLEYSHRRSPPSSSLCTPPPLLSSSVNCSLNPVRVRLQLTLPQLHMSILPPLLLLLCSAWDGAASPLRGGREGESWWSRGRGWALPACLGHSCEEQSCLSLYVSLSQHIWCVGETRPCCAVLFCPWLSMVAGFWPGYAGVGLDLRCGSAHCCTHRDEPGSFGVVSNGY